MHISADLSSVPVAGLFGGVFIAILCASTCCLGCVLYFCCTPIYYFLAGLICGCNCCGSGVSDSSKISAEGRYLVVSTATSISTYQAASDGSTRGGEYEMYKASAPMLSQEYVEVYGGSGDHSHDVTLEAYTVHPLHQRDQPIHAPRFRDVWAGLLFLANLAVVATAAIHVYLQNYSEENVKETLRDFGFGDASLADVVLGASLVFLVPVTIGTVWMSIVVNNASSIISSMLWLSALTSMAAAVLSLFSGFFFGFLLFAVFSVINVWYIHAVRDRIEFASCVLGIATNAIKLNYSGILAVLCVLGLMQMIWAVLWGNAAVLGYRYMLDETNALPWPIVAFFMLLSLYWGIQLGCAVLSTTVSGVVSCWWFQPFRPQVVRGSFFRSMSYSFGSVCLGSLMVSVIMALRGVLRMLRDSRGNNDRRRRDENLLLMCFYGLIDATLQLLEGALLYFNKYAYCYVAAYGDDFMTSGKNVMSLFGRRGWTALINDNLIANVFQLSVFVIALLSAAAGYLLGSVWHPSEGSAGFAAFLALCGGISGAAFGLLLASVLDSACAMVFVAYAEDPDALKLHHFDDFVSLHRGWTRMYPGSVNWVEFSTQVAI